MTVPFLDLAAAHAELEDELLAATRRVLRHGWYVLGPEVEAFEAEFAAYCGTRHCVGVANGLDALHLALRAWDIGPGDEVIVPSNTYIATWLAVTQAGASVAPVEPDPETMNLDPERLEAAITARTRAVIAVHLYGRPADVHGIRLRLAERGILLLEDAAQAHGAMARGVKTGGMGDAAAFSFYPTKNLGAVGDGGAVTTDDPELAARLRRLRNYGSSAKNVHAEAGFNSRLDEMQAAWLRIKLRRLDGWNKRREAVAQAYASGLAGLPLLLPQPGEREQHAWHLYVVRSTERDALARHLAAAGVQTMIHYPTPPHRQTAYAAGGWPEGAFPIAGRLHREVLSLPIGPHQAAVQTEAVITAVRGFYAVR